MSKDYLQTLVEKLIANEITLEELDQLITKNTDSNYRKVMEEVIDEVLLTTSDDDINVEDYEEMRKKIDQYVLKIPQRSAKVVYLRKIYWWAAACCCLIATGIYFYSSNNVFQGADRSTFATQDKPGADSYMSFGTTDVLSLDSLKSGERIVRDGMVLTKDVDGGIIYEATDEGYDVAPVMVSIVTAAKDTYKITLPDGSKAWLNAQSSLRFPSRFTESERNVSATGELFFEVVPAKDADDKSFVVQSDKQRIKVLGTAFNLMAYPESGYTITSLIEGKIELQVNGTKAILAPGQESVLDKAAHNLAVRRFDGEQVQAWRKGYFVFKETPLPEVLGQLAKWYGFDITESAIQPFNASVTATINRNIPISSVLKALEEITPYKIIMKNNILTLTK
ncbi:FecR family protein [Sphingobacterium pedocola]|nr:FecR family protein [Sphingobacterium pedocola]